MAGNAFSKQREVVTDEDMAREFAATDFQQKDYRNELAIAVWKLSCNYHSGSTIRGVLHRLGLATKANSRGKCYLTSKGRRYLRHATMPILQLP